MANLILADRNDGRIIAGLVTSLVFNWNRLPIGLQTAIVCHASETGFGSADPDLDADERIMAFIRTHHRAIRQDPATRSWAPRRLWSLWTRKRRVLRSINLSVPAAAFRRTWADRVAIIKAQRGTRRGLSSEFARGAQRVRALLRRTTRAEAPADGWTEAG